jgi:hypothetical protein
MLAVDTESPNFRVIFSDFKNRALDIVREAYITQIYQNERIELRKDNIVQWRYENDPSSLIETYFYEDD